MKNNINNVKYINQLFNDNEELRLLYELVKTSGKYLSKTIFLKKAFDIETGSLLIDLDCSLKTHSARNLDNNYHYLLHGLSIVKHAKLLDLSNIVFEQDSNLCDLKFLSNLESVDSLNLSWSFVDNFRALSNLRNCNHLGLRGFTTNKYDMSFTHLNIKSFNNAILSDAQNISKVDKTLYIYKYIDNNFIPNFPKMSKKEQFESLSILKEISSKFDIDLKSYLEFSKKDINVIGIYSNV
jgi:hypothetical protein